MNEIKPIVEWKNMSLARRAALAARVAMRVLPVLTQTQNGYATEGTAQTAFWFWCEDKRQTHLLKIFRSYAGGVYFSLKGNVKTWLGFRAMWFTGAEAYSTDAYPCAAAAAAAYAYAYAAAAADVDAYGFAYAVAADAASAAVSAANAAKLFYQPICAKQFEQQFVLDLTLLQTQSAAQLLAQPLWHSTPPEEWLQSWHVLRGQIRQLDSSFSIWLDWYADRIHGVEIDLPLLEKWVDLPPEIDAGSPAEINTYMTKIGNGLNHHRLKQVRTIFLGYGEAGKTSLIRALHGETIVEGKEPMTPGIDIREWRGAGDGILTHFWDFGGQVIAHSTHQFFLRTACLYVVVLSARNEVNATEQAEYWLQHVKAYGEDSPVFIVRNKSDQMPLHLDMGTLKIKYPNILADFPIACTQAKSGPLQAQFAAFEIAFHQQLQTLAQRQVMFSAEQFTVLHNLQIAAKQQAFLTNEHFQTMCEQHGIPQEGVQNRGWLLGLLDRLGVIIHFPQLALMQEHVINPRWLTFGVYKIMYAGQPRLSVDDINNILSCATLTDERGQGLAYPQAKCQFIAMAMESFKLCYSLRGDRRQYIIPGLLETDLPANIASANFNKADALAYKISFIGFIPRHVMPELIVERNEEIIGELVWQYGALLKHSNLDARCWMQVDYHNKEMTLWVTDRDAREYLAVLRDALLKILARLKLVKFEKINLPTSALCSNATEFRHEPDWAVYQQIESNIKRGAQTFISETGREYNLSKLGNFYLPPTPAPNVAAAGKGTIKIFLASSYELKSERDDFELYLRQQNDHFQEQGIYFKVVRWENFLDAMSATRKQDDYNAEVSACDVFLSLFATKTGKYTKEEFTVAHECFQRTGRPYIYTFFKDASISTAEIDKTAMKSLWAFQERLEQLGHFYTNFSSIEDLKLRFAEQLKLLIKMGKLR